MLRPREPCFGVLRSKTRGKGIARWVRAQRAFGAASVGDGSATARGNAQGDACPGLATQPVLGLAPVGGGGPEESPRPFRWLDLKSLEAKCAVCSMIPSLIRG